MMRSLHRVSSPVKRRRRKFSRDFPQPTRIPPTIGRANVILFAHADYNCPPHPRAPS
jgi:hypothetical protein